MVIILLQIFVGIKLTGENTAADANEKCDDGEIKTAQVCNPIYSIYQICPDLRIEFYVNCIALLISLFILKNGTLDTVDPSDEKPGSQAAAESANASKPIPGTTLKCLEDPSFEFESSAPAETETCINQPPPAKKPAYRVLEGKFINRISYLIHHVI